MVALRAAALVIILAGVPLAGLARPARAQAATSTETAAVQWAQARIGSTAWYGLCLPFTYDAYSQGAGLNLERLTTGVAYNSNTDPQDVWGHTASGTTGTGSPPYGALVFFDAKPGYSAEYYSHVAIMGDGGEMISTPDAFNESTVHYETMAQEAGSGSYSVYMGWWLPDGSAGGGGGPIPDGTFVSYQGNVYRIAGGAPVYINSWGPFGGAQPTEALTAAQWAALPQMPANGTTISGAETGQVYKIAGGAPLYLNSCDAGCGSPVAVSQYAIDHNGTPPGGVWHLNTVPADGTTLETPASETGRIYKVAGGAPLWLNSCDADCGAPVEVNQYTIDDNGAAPGGAWHLNTVPVDGTTLETPASEGGRIYKVAGGAPLYLASCAAGCGAPVQVNQYTIDGNGAPPGAVPHLNTYPANGVFVRAQDTGRIYRAAGGAAIYVTDCGALGFAGCNMPLVSVNQYTVDALGAPVGALAHLRSMPADGTLLLGLPSSTTWQLRSGQRTPAPASPSAVAVNDASLAAFPVPVSGAGAPAPSGGAPTPVTGAGGGGGTASGGGHAPSAPAGGRRAWRVARCVVPRLSHLTLRVARLRLRRAHCAVGVVRRPRRVRRRHTLRVWRQSARPGSAHPRAFRVRLTLR